MQNLDLECAKLGRELAGVPGVDEKRLAKLVTDALAVLEEQGLYAYFLYLKSRPARERRAADRIAEKSAAFLKRMPPGAGLLADDETFTALQSLAADIDRLLFARELLRQALVYGRYHAKTSDGGAG